MTPSHADAGSVILFDKTDGSEIGRVEGGAVNSQIGGGNAGSDSVVPLVGVSRYVIVSPSDNTDGANTGSVRLVNSTTGLEIASTRISGGIALGNRGVTALDNGNFVIFSDEDNPGGLAGAGSIILVNGSTGAIVSRFDGNHTNDYLSRSDRGIIRGGHYYFTSWTDSTGSMIAHGSAYLMDKDTGTVLSYMEGEAQGIDVGLNGLVSHPNFDYALLPNSLYDDQIDEEGRLIVFPFDQITTP